ncbi:MAG TPA: heparan-alpha-glucosaminide N-acetyltransferase domain-containing protein [Pyrinomonadaceae bacterium]|nr:heparan-alpha-glucosaminide N-acetyltransferase domain-containing protein [Pyrinomonadaceae bacterium]
MVPLNSPESSEAKRDSSAPLDPETYKPTLKRRIDSIDLLRGIVMVIMLLDHTRDFVHRDVLQGFDPTDLAHTNPMLFFTRWITHFCAPIFVFLAGTGAYLQFARGKSKAELSKFLLTRGLWLVLLEFTVVRCAAFLNFDYTFLGVMQVIWVLGVSMIVLAALIHLPLRIVGMFGVLMIVLHNFLDRFRVQGMRSPNDPLPGFWAKLYILLHQPFEPLPILMTSRGPLVAFVIYPLIPWVGVMAAGYAFGALYRMEAARRRRLLVMLGGVTTALFFVLRFINIYVDPSRWTKQSTVSLTIISFLNVTKYPPSLAFLLMTLGPAFLALAWFESRRDKAGATGTSKLREFFITFGRVPLFFYLLQWPMAHLTSMAAHLIGGKPIRWMFGTTVQTTGPPPGMGFNLLVVYICWIVGVLLLYPLCKWFAGVKQRHRSWWLSYL